MKAEITYKTEDILVIDWSKKSVGFGQLTISKSKDSNELYLDTECMGIDFVLEVFNALKSN